MLLLHVNLPERKIFVQTPAGPAIGQTLLKYRISPCNVAIGIQTAGNICIPGVIGIEAQLKQKIGKLVIPLLDLKGRGLFLDLLIN